MVIIYDSINAWSAKDLATSLNDYEIVYRVRRVRVYAPSFGNNMWTAFIIHAGKKTVPMSDEDYENESRD